MKILEGVIYQRKLPLVEPKLYGGQYAYRRSRGTEHHLTTIMDCVNRALLRKEGVYIISSDIAGAFDRVSHYQLTWALRRYGIDERTHRLIHNWLQGRKFCVKYRTPKGLTIGPATSMSAGLPQGGILSPLLWNMFFNDVPEQLDALRVQRGLPTAAHLDLVFADDMTTIITHPEPSTLRHCARHKRTNVHTVMNRRHLQLQDPKTFNVPYDPQSLPHGIYRRRPPLTIKSTKTRLLHLGQTLQDASGI